MLHSYGMFHGCHAYVSRYYHRGEWCPVPDWDVLDRMGEPHRIVIAEERCGKYYFTNDVEASPVYSECGYLSGAYGDEPSHEELEAVSPLCRFTGQKRVLLWAGGGKFVPALMSYPEQRPFVNQRIADMRVSWLLGRYPESDARTAGRLRVVFDMDPEWALPQTQSEPTQLEQSVF